MVWKGYCFATFLLITKPTAEIHRGAIPTLGPDLFAQNTLNSGHPTSGSSCVYGSNEA